MLLSLLLTGTSLHEHAEASSMSAKEAGQVQLKGMLNTKIKNSYLSATCQKQAQASCLQAQLTDNSIRSLLQTKTAQALGLFTGLHGACEVVHGSAAKGIGASG